MTRDGWDWVWSMRSLTDFEAGARGEEPGGVDVAEVVTLDRRPPIGGRRGAIGAWLDAALQALLATARPGVPILTGTTESATSMSPRTTSFNKARSACLSTNGAPSPRTRSPDDQSAPRACPCHRRRAQRRSGFWPHPSLP